jgi:hypothetical protein
LVERVDFFSTVSSLYLDYIPAADQEIIQFISLKLTTNCIRRIFGGSSNEMPLQKILSIPCIP